MRVRRRQSAPGRLGVQVLDDLHGEGLGAGFIKSFHSLSMEGQGQMSDFEAAGRLADLGKHFLEHLTTS